MKVSLILPIYNEIKNLQKGVVDRVVHYAKHHPEICEILIVDDGSTDQSIDVIKKDYLKELPLLKLVQKVHSGKAFTVMEGIKQAKGTHVLFSDIDLATPIEEADKLIASAERGADIVIGSRSSTREGAPLTRKIMARGFMIIRNIVIGLHGIRDTQCGFKIFNREKALTIIKKMRVFGTEKEIKGSSVSAGFDLEFLFIAKKLRCKITEIPVVWRHVETKNVNFIKDTFETLRDIIVIKWNDITKKYD
ncbi:MAG: glycosyltransferase [Patescibacteria group bacterium]|jgi:glycosyltransferase involved in cell wall biosynthesis